MLSSFPRFDGHTELTAGHLNGLLDQMRRQGRLIPVPPVEVVQVGDGWQVRVAGAGGRWAVLGAAVGPGRYAWEAALPAANGGWEVDPFGPTGGAAHTARETGGRDDVPAGTVAWLVADAGGPADETLYSFAAPPAAAAGGDLPFWAEVTGVAGGQYAYREVALLDGGFRDLPGGRGGVDGYNKHRKKR